MKTVYITELNGCELEYVVAALEGEEYFPEATSNGIGMHFPATNYSAGPDGDNIIDREGITVIRCDDDFGTDTEGFTTNERIPVWAATVGQHAVCLSTEHQQHEPMYQICTAEVFYGPTRRIAALRAYVAYETSKRNKRSVPAEVVAVPDNLH